jgi:hypothetical protein
MRYAKYRKDSIGGTGAGIRIIVLSCNMRIRVLR